MSTIPSAVTLPILKNDQKALKNALKELTSNVYDKLDSRQIAPLGTWDNGGRFYIDDLYSDLINVRNPSRSWPLSQWKAAHTRKFVSAVALKFQAFDEESLLKHFRIKK